MLLIVRVLLLITGLALLINMLLQLVRSHFHIGFTLVTALGLALVGYAIAWEGIHQHMTRGWGLLCRGLFYAGLVAVLAFIVFLNGYGACDTVTYDEEVLIVLGCSVNGEQVSDALRNRLDTALAYLSRNRQACVVVSGGQGPGEDVTEAVAMARYLVAGGIAESRIILEEKATSTEENMRLSKDLLDERFDAPYRTAVVTNGFHIYRTVSWAEALDWPVTHLAAPLLWSYWPIANMRECAAVLKLWLWDQNPLLSANL